MGDLVFLQRNLVLSNFLLTFTRHFQVSIELHLELEHLTFVIIRISWYVDLKVWQIESGFKLVVNNLILFFALFIMPTLTQRT